MCMRNKERKEKATSKKETRLPRNKQQSTRKAANDRVAEHRTEETHKMWNWKLYHDQAHADK